MSNPLSGISAWFGFGWGGEVPKQQIPNIFPLSVNLVDFIRLDTINIYSRILTDCVERTQDIPEERMSVLWDNCLKSESSHGLITMLAYAMADKRELLLVYEKAVNVIRKATEQEAVKIKQDYSTSGKSVTGVFISFETYRRTDLIRLYSMLEYAVLGSLNKEMNLSAAIQLKMSDLRQAVSLVDNSDPKAQAVAIAQSLGQGKDVMLDAKDEILTAKPDLTAIEKALDTITKKRSFYLGLPCSYITGEQTGGIGSTGENDTKAVERGLKSYYVSILKPVLDALLGIKANYKSQDFRQVDQGLNALKTFALTDEEFISAENKTLIINRLFDLAEDSEGDPTPEPDPNAPPKIGAPVPTVQNPKAV